MKLRLAPHSSGSGKSREIDIKDAKKILNDADNEVTLYFKDKTYKQLEEIFKSAQEGVRR